MCAVLFQLKACMIVTQVGKYSDSFGYFLHRKRVSMTGKFHNHRPQINSRQLEEETQNTNNNTTPRTE